MKNKVIGVVCLILGILIIISTIITLYGNPIYTILTLFVLFYVSYKTLYKKEDLTKWEWIALVAFLLFYFVISPLLFLLL